MSNALRGIISGFIATLVLSAVILLKLQFHISPDLSVLAQISKLAGGTVGGWMDHFIIGTLIWGLLFAGFDSVTPPIPCWLKGLLFSVLAWLVTMVFFLPFVGLGLFGTKVGLEPAAVNLVQHLIYGLVLGITYGLLGFFASAKAPEQSRQT